MRVFVFTLMLLIAANLVRAENLTICAAISLKESLTQIGSGYEKQTGDQISFNFDASGKLAAQIKQGAPVDLFISADDEQMDKLGKAGKINQKSRHVVVENELVLIVSKQQKNPPTGFSDLIDSGTQKVAIGEPKTVPAGRYAMQVFKSLKVDQAISSRLVMGESVRQVLVYVEQNQVRAGLVYRTDAMQGGDKVKIVAVADPKSHEKIEYSAAVVTESKHAESAGKFLDYLMTDPAKSILIAHGFVIPTPAPTSRPSP